MTQPTHNQYDARTAADTGRFVPLHSVSAFGELVEPSDLETVVVFQHDPYCPISRKAYREIAGEPVQAVLVDVTHDEELSRTIEQQTGVRHESPQVLVFRSSKVVWNASHFKITGNAVTRAVQRASADSSAPVKPIPSAASPAEPAPLRRTQLRTMPTCWHGSARSGVINDCRPNSPSRSRWSFCLCRS